MSTNVVMHSPIQSKLRIVRRAARPERTLLIVDDDNCVCNAVSRLFVGRFDRILMANTSGEAASVLSAYTITHLICDYWLGSGEPTGIDLIPKWRKAHTSICRAIVFSGTDLNEIDIPLGVDKILRKPVDLRTIVRETCDPN
ncbi:MAG: hypothetical protein QNJ97_04155 [Myxococcota bacterium]|nr:hypothetical protein [Myxococcota bacterium]